MPGTATSVHRMHGDMFLGVNLFVLVRLNPVVGIDTNGMNNWNAPPVAAGGGTAASLGVGTLPPPGWPANWPTRGGTGPLALVLPKRSEGAVSIGVPPGMSTEVMLIEPGAVLAERTVVLRPLAVMITVAAPRALPPVVMLAWPPASLENVKDAVAKDPPRCVGCRGCAGCAVALLPTEAPSSSRHVAAWRTPRACKLPGLTSVPICMLTSTHISMA